MTSRWRRVKADAPALAPGLDVVVVVGPGELARVSSWRRASRCSAVSRLSQPSTLRVGRSCRPAVFGEVGEADLALVALAVVGDEEQVVRGPGRPLGAVGRGALLERQLAQDAAQGDDGKPLRLELDEEDAPGLVRSTSGRSRLISWILAAVFGVDAEFLRLCSRRSDPRSRRDPSMGQPSSSRR